MIKYWISLPVIQRLVREVESHCWRNGIASAIIVVLLIAGVWKSTTIFGENTPSRPSLLPLHASMMRIGRTSAHSMSPLVSLAGFIFADPEPFVQAPILSQQQTQSKGGSIEGRVVRASNGEAISGVFVTLAAPGSNIVSVGPAATASVEAQQQIARLVQNGQIVSRSGAPVTVDTVIQNSVVASRGPDAAVSRDGAAVAGVTTAEDGRFSFKNLAPGRYILRTQRDGYFGQTVNGVAPTVATKTVLVEEDKTANVDVGMIQGGVIRGLIRDPDGNPVPGYPIITARLGYTNGREVWLLSLSANADDRGEYRKSWFPPGEYFVGTGPRGAVPSTNIQSSWARVYFPGTTDINRAVPVIVKEGSEAIANLDIQVKTTKTFRVSGVAVNPLPNLKTNPTTGVVDRSVGSLVLMPLDVGPMDNPPTTSSTSQIPFSSKASGEFEIRDVDPGRYDLYAMVQDNQARRFWTGHTIVQIRDQDITGLNLELSAGGNLTGEVAIQGISPTPLPFEKFRVALQPLGTLPAPVGLIIGSVPVDATGKFSIPSVSEGRYRINLQGVSANAYISDIRQSGASVFDDGIALDRGAFQSLIQISVRSDGEVIEGSVQGKGAKPAANATVVIVPAMARQQNPALFRNATTDDVGHFTLAGVAPGEYTIFAWESVLPGAWQNANFLAKYQSRGRLLNVVPQGHTNVQLELITAE